MSKRPYLTKVGAAEYMIRASNREQAIRIALGAYPSPVCSAAAANADEVARWAMAGKPFYGKDDFVADLPQTMVLYCDPDGRILASDELRAAPGNYFLIIEPTTALPPEKFQADDHMNRDDPDAAKSIDAREETQELQKAVDAAVDAGMEALIAKLKELRAVKNPSAEIRNQIVEVRKQMNMLEASSRPDEVDALEKDVEKAEADLGLGSSPLSTSPLDSDN